MWRKKILLHVLCNSPVLSSHIIFMLQIFWKKNFNFIQIAWKTQQSCKHKLRISIHYCLLDWHVNASLNISLTSNTKISSKLFQVISNILSLWFINVLWLFIACTSFIVLCNFVSKNLSFVFWMFRYSNLN